MLSTLVCLTLATETPAIEENPLAVVVKKKHFADMWIPHTGQ